MTSIYLALTDAAGVLERQELSRTMHTMPANTEAQYAAMRAVADKWAATRDTVQETCTRCGREHDALWRIRRVLADTLGVWPVYRINGARVLLGDGIPYTVSRLPRDAERVRANVAAAYWHDDGEPPAGSILRAAIRAHNDSVSR